MKRDNKIIAAICGGPVFLANSGILKGLNCTASIKNGELSYFQETNLVEKDFVLAGNILTAKGQAFSDFAIELGKHCKVIESDQEAINSLKWLRNDKN
ncbi:MAG: DJ-1/PfpI family protein [Promethearchaeota archaeon]